MSFFAWRPYVPVAQRRRNAEKKLRKLIIKGQSADPVRIEGRTIVKSFWGKSWCTNLERYSDFANRLPRGRTYLRNGSVLDLRIAEGRVAALVAGSRLYRVAIDIEPLTTGRWKEVCRDCAGSINSLVELLQGRLSKAVMDRVCREDDGLFPAPAEIKLSCSCPDWAEMCKHVAAVLYGIGARLDQRPELLFALRGVDSGELLASAGQDLPLNTSAPNGANVLEEDDVAALFGLDMAAPIRPEASARGRHRRTTPRKRAPKRPAARKRKARRPRRVRAPTPR